MTRNNGDVKPTTPRVQETAVLKGPIPEEDGEFHVYSAEVSPGVFSPRLAEKVTIRRITRRRVLYVNGMGGNPLKHRAQACAVAAVTGTKVWGVYNASDGMVGDLLQCLGDKLTGKWQMRMGAAGSSIKAFFTGADKPTTIRADMLEALRENNPATASMFELLSSPGFEDAPIFAHSQGNIITCNALNALAVLKGPGALSRLKLFGFGSPVTFWPDGVDVNLFGFDNDPITYLSLVHTDTNDASYGTTTYVSGDKSEVIQTWNPGHWTDRFNPDARLSHAFYIYVEAYWDTLAEELSD